MFCAMIVSACPERVSAGSLVARHPHRRAHVRRQIGRGPHDQLKDAVEEGWEHDGQYTQSELKC